MKTRIIFRFTSLLCCFISLLIITTCKKNLYTPPELTLTGVSDITFTNAKCWYTIKSDGGGTILERGVCWSTNPSPTTTNNKTKDNTWEPTFSPVINGLIYNTKYYVRAYATNFKGTSYSEELSFKTPNPGLPTVNTSALTNITQTAATCGGNVTNSGGTGVAVTAKGLCWSTSPNPSIANSYSTNGSGLGTFSYTITGLTYNTTYYVRAYAVNAVGIAYGNEVFFTAGQSITSPIITTNSVSNVSYYTTTSGGNISSDGGATVSARGVCWSISNNPTISGNHTTDGNGMGNFISNITNLNPNTTYHIRAYATNIAGTAYGNEVGFITLPLTVPTVTTLTVSYINHYTATIVGDVTLDGGSIVTTKGVCWSTNINPTINDNYTNSGSGIGYFSSSLSGLLAGTTYYVRAYATNSNGTGYGNSLSFTTIPTVTDADGNVYHVVTIGTQVWMDENLKTTKYRNGTTIPNVTDGVAWANLTTGAYCDYENNSSNSAIYGRLYNWYVITNPNNICPLGWHIPSNAEWLTLANYNGGVAIGGGPLKEAGTTHWIGPNTGATNATGFTALPGGYNLGNGLFVSIGEECFFWSSIEYTATDAWTSDMFYDNSSLSSNFLSKKIGVSIRCIKD